MSTAWVSRSRNPAKMPRVRAFANWTRHRSRRDFLSRAACHRPMHFRCTSQLRAFHPDDLQASGEAAGVLRQFRNSLFYLNGVQLPSLPAQPRYLARVLTPTQINDDHCVIVVIITITIRTPPFPRSKLYFASANLKSYRATRTCLFRKQSRHPS
jgi:hypothetical protein